MVAEDLKFGETALPDKGPEHLLAGEFRPLPLDLLDGDEELPGRDLDRGGDREIGGQRGFCPGLSSRAVFDRGVKDKVAVLPGLPFYVDGGGTDTIRLNFSSASEEQITEGMHRLARVIASFRQ